MKAKSDKWRVEDRKRNLCPSVRLPLSVVLFLLFFSLAAFLSSGCGYHFAGAANLPQGIQSVRFATFENETLEVGVEKEFQWAIEREFRNRSGLAITEDGEGIVDGVLRQLDLRPLSFDSKDQVLEYQLVVIFDVSLTHRDSEKVLWQASGLRVTSDYSAIPQVVVTTSPEFQRGTLNSEDLQGLTDVQFSETQRHIAMGRLFAAAAREVYFRLGDDF